jgi:hypothetical protein
VTGPIRCQPLRARLPRFCSQRAEVDSVVLRRISGIPGVDETPPVKQEIRVAMKFFAVPTVKRGGPGEGRRRSREPATGRRYL